MNAICTRKGYCLSKKKKKKEKEKKKIFISLNLDFNYLSFFGRIFLTIEEIKKIKKKIY